MAASDPFGESDPFDQDAAAAADPFALHVQEGAADAMDSPEALAAMRKLYQALDKARGVAVKAVASDERTRFLEAMDAYGFVCQLLRSSERDVPARLADLLKGVIAQYERRQGVVRNAFEAQKMRSDQETLHYGRGAQEQLRKLWRHGGAHAFMLYFGVRKLRHGRLHVRVLELDFMNNTLCNSKDGKAHAIFKFGEIHSVSLTKVETLAGNWRDEAAIYGVKVEFVDRKELVMVLQTDSERESLLELLERIRNRRVTPNTLKPRVRRLRLHEGRLSMRKPPSGLLGLSQSWRDCWAIVFEGALHVFAANPRSRRGHGSQEEELVEQFTAADHRPIHVAWLAGLRLLPEPLNMASQPSGRRMSMKEGVDPDLNGSFPIGDAYFRAPTPETTRDFLEAVKNATDADYLNTSLVDEMLAARERGREVFMSKVEPTLSAQWRVHPGVGDGDRVIAEALADLWMVAFGKENPSLRKVQASTAPLPRRVAADAFQSEKWRGLGFASSDPRSELSSTGVLGLSVLLHFARTRPHRFAAILKANGAVADSALSRADVASAATGVRTLDLNGDGTFSTHAFPKLAQAAIQVTHAMVGLLAIGTGRLTRGAGFAEYRLQSPHLAFIGMLGAANVDVDQVFAELCAIILQMMDRPGQTMEECMARFKSVLMRHPQHVRLISSFLLNKGFSKATRTAPPVPQTADEPEAKVIDGMDALFN